MYALVLSLPLQGRLRCTAADHVWPNRRRTPPLSPALKVLYVQSCTESERPRARPCSRESRAQPTLRSSRTSTRRRAWVVPRPDVRAEEVVTAANPATEAFPGRDREPGDETQTGQRQTRHEVAASAHTAESAGQLTFTHQPETRNTLWVLRSPTEKCCDSSTEERGESEMYGLSVGQTDRKPHRHRHKARRHQHRRCHVIRGSSAGPVLGSLWLSRCDTVGLDEPVSPW